MITDIQTYYCYDRVLFVAFNSCRGLSSNNKGLQVWGLSNTNSCWWTKKHRLGGEILSLYFILTQTKTDIVVKLQIKTCWLYRAENIQYCTTNWQKKKSMVNGHGFSIRPELCPPESPGSWSEMGKFKTHPSMYRTGRFYFQWGYPI